MSLTNISGIKFYLAANEPKLSYDYTPQWGRGSPNNYIDTVTFPQVLKDKKYAYRVVKDDVDLGSSPPYSVESDGSQKVNFLEYNKGYGIADTSRIQVYVVDPDTGNRYLIAKWN